MDESGSCLQLVAQQILEISECFWVLDDNIYLKVKAAIIYFIIFKIVMKLLWEIFT